MMAYKTISNLLSETETFSCCKAKELQILTDGSEIIQFKKGDVLSVDTTMSQYYYFIKCGQVNLFRETSDGIRFVFDVLQSGRFFGLNAAFDDATPPYNILFIKPTELVCLSAKKLKACISSNSELALTILKVMAAHSFQQSMEIEHRTYQDASQRICCYLLRLTCQKKKGPIMINLPHDKAVIAALLGMQPETFSRALAKLEFNKAINIHETSIEVPSLEQLSKISCLTCSSFFPCKIDASFPS